MHKDHTPQIKTWDANKQSRREHQRALKDDGPVNTALQDKLRQDRNALHNNLLFKNMSTFYRVVPVGMVDKRLFSVVKQERIAEEHTLASFYPASMTIETAEKFFGDIQGEVHFDDAIILLKKSSSQFCFPEVVKGSLPEWLDGKVMGSWTNSARLMDFIHRETIQHYAKKRQKPQVVHETYREAMQGKNYKQAAEFLNAGLTNLMNHAYGEHKLDKEEIEEIVAMIKTASTAPRLHAYIKGNI